MESMPMNMMTELLALSAPPPGTQANPQGDMYKMLGMFGIMGLMIYLLFIRPQRQQQKRLDALVKGLKAGDKILTSSGIIGVVIGVKDKSVSIRSADTKLEILKTAVSEVTERAGASSES
jgi:preprotein translocase subunit YajC